MRRLIVLALALLFTVFFAGLTVSAVRAQGHFTFGAALSLFILILLLVGVLGAWRSPPQG
ncbi:MAG TPA: hypothetical protein VIC05_07060 [Solirubrobacteraceae bacterium]